MDIRHLHKCFSIGLALDSNVDSYKKLFADYGKYIDNLYFSPPLGEKFHGRNKIAQQLVQPLYIERFWNILYAAQSAGIALEVVYNTHLLCNDDITYSGEIFDKHGIILSKICVQDQYYDYVRELYPTIKIVHSVNCMPDDKFKIIDSAKYYDEYVVGRQYTRDSDLFRAISEMGSSCVLLLNNGCSHFCGGCATPEHCRNAFEQTKIEKNMTPEQIYSLQSIIPSELHEKLIDLSNVSLLKLSTRNADTDYIRQCLDSYINGVDRKLIEKSTDYYLLWSRLMWCVRYFKDFDFDRIYQYKKELVI